MWIWVFSSFGENIYIPLLGVCLGRSGVPGVWGMHIISFSRYSQRFLNWLNQFTSLLAVNESSVVLPLQQHFILPVFFLIRQGCHKYEAISHCNFNLHFPMTNKLSTLLCLSTICIPSVQFSSVTQSHPTLCSLMDYSMPSLPVHHKLPEFIQTHVHWIGDAIQPPHPLSSPSPPTFNLSQHQGLFKWVRSSYQVAKTLEFQLQHQSFQWIFRTDFL